MSKYTILSLCFFSCVIFADSIRPHLNEDTIVSLPCMNKNNKCDFYLQEDKRGDFGDLYLTRSVDNQRIFDEPEIKAMRTYPDLDKIMSDYFITLSSATFPLKYDMFIFNASGATILPKKYMSVERFYDHQTGEEYWEGYYCTTTLPIPIDEKNLPIKNSPIDWGYNNLCNPQSPHASEPEDQQVTGELSAVPRQMIKDGNTIIEFPYYENGVYIRNMKFIFLDSEGGSYLPNIACLEQCVDTSKQSRYVGKINNKYKIYLAMTKDGENINGVYLYSSTKKPINLSGKINNDNIELSVSDNKKLTEKFTGKIDKGVISGTWESFVSKNKYPFILYLTPFN